LIKRLRLIQKNTSKLRCNQFSDKSGVITQKGIKMQMKAKIKKIIRQASNEIKAEIKTAKKATSR